MKTLKDIYIIKNDMNNKVYVGQAINPKYRFHQHCNYNKQNKSLINEAIQKYGKKHFHYEILEAQVENYDEREQYWIKYYNSITPFGYNITIGGNSIKCGIYNINAIIKDKKIIDDIIYKLRYTKLSQYEIAKEYNVKQEMISRINNGIAYKNNDIDYPIRKER